MQSITVGQHTFQIEGTDEVFQASLSQSQIEEGVALIHLNIASSHKQVPPVCKLTWFHPSVDIQAFWHTGADRNKGFQVDTEKGFKSQSTALAPIGSLYNINGQNRLTFAFSDALNSISVRAGLHEETASFRCVITLFEDPMEQIDSYSATLRIDTRDIPYEKSIHDVQHWWTTLPGYEPASVPTLATMPMYSTWYCFHQEFTSEAIEHQCKLAKAMGCEAVIVDDGWQTLNNQRGYAYCGDWEVCTDKIPDMKAHVEAVHRMGMKYILWYSVPFVGWHSRAWERFKHKLLGVREDIGAGILDPRYPDVREYLINLYEQAVKEWDLDGFKLDFVDSFRLIDASREETADGRDYESVPVAVDRLLTDIMNRLRALKPDILIEFRQTYVGPLMRKYGNMFRAADCPNEAILNRVRTIDLRLMSGNTAVHADMVTWHAEDTVESAALQMINILFAVPQISVLIDKLPEAHLRMLKYWLSFFQEHRELLLSEDLHPLQPELLYPVVMASHADKQVIAMYADYIAAIDEKVKDHLMIVNGKLNTEVILKVTNDIGIRQVEIRNCVGEVVRTETLNLTKGLHELNIPQAGLASITRS